jgi:hypothetical protein
MGCPTGVPVFISRLHTGIHWSFYTYLMQCSELSCGLKIPQIEQGGFDILILKAWCEILHYDSIMQPLSGILKDQCRVLVYAIIAIWSLLSLSNRRPQLCHDPIILYSGNFIVIRIINIKRDDDSLLNFPSPLLRLNLNFISELAPPNYRSSLNPSQNTSGAHIDPTQRQWISDTDNRVIVQPEGHQF